MTREDSTGVVVVGAGPTGLTLALVLARRGVPVTVLERDAGPIEQSRALWVHARTLELWQSVGVTGAVEAGRPTTGIDMLVEGRRRGRLPYAGDGLTAFPFGLVLEQSRTQRLLLDALAEVGVRPLWRHEVRDVVDSGDDVLVHASVTATGAGVTLQAAYAVGADGASSAVRRGLGLQLHGATYPTGSFLADVVADVPLDPERIHLALTRDDFAAFFPMAGDRRWRLIGSLRDGQQIDRAAVAPDGVQALVRQASGVDLRVEQVGWATGYRVHRRMVERYRVGRVLLAGDAAHVHSPAGGQGMNTGIGDAVALGWRLAAVVLGQLPAAALDEYEAERVPVARGVLGRTDRLFQIEAGSGAVAARGRVLAMPALAAVLSGWGPARRWFFRFLSQTGLSYRSTRRLGKAQVGDRLPYAPLTHGGSTSDLVHVQEHTLLLAVPDRQGSGTGLDGAATALAARSGLPVAVHVLGPDERAAHRALGTRRPTVLLVRPDGHIAARGRATRASSLERVLTGALPVTGAPPVAGRDRAPTPVPTP
jgi:2-polyprenyl-6-methoxyphenol hydroxylase-like FAD-dependent oxidoreductase